MSPIDTSAGATRLVALVCALAVAAALVPGAAAGVPLANDAPDAEAPTAGQSLADQSPAGQSPADQTVGADVVVGPDETVSDLEVVSGDAVVHGTVEGDVEAAAGSVRITGEVTDDVEAAAGSVTVEGRVGGTVEAAAGSVEVGPDATVGGDVEAAAGTVTVAGAVDGDVTGSETVRLEDGATIRGDVAYGETLDRADGAAVAGTVTHDESLQLDGLQWGITLEDLDALGELAVVPSPVVSLVTAIGALVVGALLLVVFPDFSGEMVETVTDQPGRSAAAGLATMIAVPAVLLAVAITIVGLPLAFAGGAVFALATWLALVYGEYLVGTRVLDAAGADNRWAALVVGVVGVELLAQIPLFGDLLTFAVVLLGLGTGALTIAARRRGGDDGSAETPPPDPAPGAV
ncbi:bactofilin family protein [Halosimplex pelagicum]|uniref:Polymer-forming cytoskeletal protein n=1 Tax=Halosimplex pelagicum TaxID=869886 RepID=A0A7D5PFC1_9EURY|nr:polymer-forming cytoskeletal protein [Halosimplex pelagicum]QLH82579.1 polymer-forming cytoskeletal protein [Halosimplex pelagicum]